MNRYAQTFVLVALVVPATAQIAVHADALPILAREQAVRAAEIAAAEAGRLWSIDPTKVAADLTLHAEQSGYEAAEQTLTNGRFRDNGAFALGGQAHVQVQPILCEERMGEIGLPMQTLRLIGHETAHLVRNTLPNHPSHPQWLTDATGQLVSEHTARTMGVAPDRATDPWISTQIHRLKNAATHGRLPALDMLLSDGHGDLNPSERYAARWALGAWMQETGMLGPILAFARRTGGGSRYADQLRTHVLETARVQGIREPDAHFREWILAHTAPWDEVLRSLAVSPDDPERWTQIAFPNSNAVAWTTAPQPRDRYTIRGTVRILPGERQQMNILLARSPDGFVSVALTAGWGVTVFHYTSSENRWTRLAAQETSIRTGVPLGFSVHAADGHVQVEIDGNPVINVPSPVSVAGPWGVGAQSGSAGIWQGVDLSAEP